MIKTLKGVQILITFYFEKFQDTLSMTDIPSSNGLNRANLNFEI